jgi:hypothetical protein
MEYLTNFKKLYFENNCIEFIPLCYKYLLPSKAINIAILEINLNNGDIIKMVLIPIKISK